LEVLENHHVLHFLLLLQQMTAAETEVKGAIYRCLGLGCPQLTLLVSLGCWGQSPERQRSLSDDCPEVISKGVSERPHPAPEVCPSTAGCLAASRTCCSGIAPAGGGLQAVEKEVSLLPCMQTHSLLLAFATEAAAPRQALGSPSPSAGSQPLAGGARDGLLLPPLAPTLWLPLGPLWSAGVLVPRRRWMGGSASLSPWETRELL